MIEMEVMHFHKVTRDLSSPIVSVLVNIAVLEFFKFVNADYASEAFQVSRRARPAAVPYLCCSQSMNICQYILLLHDVFAYHSSRVIRNSMLHLCKS